MLRFPLRLPMGIGTGDDLNDTRTRVERKARLKRTIGVEERLGDDGSGAIRRGEG